MATPDFHFNVHDLLKWAKSKGFKTPKKDPYAPYRVGKREYHKSPGHRSWSETWVHPRRPEPGDDPWEKNFNHDYHITHQGTDFIHWPEFWEEVEMLTGPEATVEELRAKMGHLDAEAVEAGYRHYYDKFTWEDGSERVRKLRDAFEAEHHAPSGSRIFDKTLRSLELNKIYNEIMQDELINNIIIDDSANNMGLVAA